MAYADSAAVAGRLGRTLTQDEASWAEFLLDDIETAIKVRIPDLDAQIVAGTIDLDTVIRVEAWAVVRYMKNPDGKYQESLDDYSFTRDRAISSGILGLTDEDWNDLLSSGVSSSAFTIQSPATPFYAPSRSPW